MSEYVGGCGGRLTFDVGDVVGVLELCEFNRLVGVDAVRDDLNDIFCELNLLVRVIARSMCIDE